MGRGAQAGAIREEGPGRLCGRTASRLLAARLSLDRRRTRTLVVRTLLADAVFEIPAAAEGPATGEAARRAHPRFSRVTVADDVPYSCRPNAGAGADPDSNPSPLPVVDVGAVTPVPYVVAVSASIVVRTIATAIASSEGEYPLVFLVGSRMFGQDSTMRHVCFTHCHPHTHTSCSPAHTSFLSPCHSLAFYHSLLLLLSFMLYHTFLSLSHFISSLHSFI